MYHHKHKIVPCRRINNRRHRLALGTFVSCGAFASAALTGVAVPQVVDPVPDTAVAASEQIFPPTKQVRKILATTAAEIANKEGSVSAEKTQLVAAAAESASEPVLPHPKQVKNSSTEVATGTAVAAETPNKRAPASTEIDTVVAAESSSDSSSGCNSNGKFDGAGAKRKANSAIFLVVPQQLECTIQTYGKEEFMKRFGQIFKDPTIAKLINGIRENKHEVKAILTNLVAEDESVFASEIEVSDQDFDDRRHKQENSVQPGKMGMIVFLFKRVLEWIFGKEFLEEALEAGKKERIIRDRLRDQGITNRNINPQQLQEILDMNISKNAPFKGTVFDPFQKKWPDMQTLFHVLSLIFIMHQAYMWVFQDFVDSSDTLDAAPILLKRSLHKILNKLSEDAPVK